MNDHKKTKRTVKIIVKSLFIFIVAGIIGLPFLTGGMKNPGNPLSHKEIGDFDTVITEVFTLGTPSQPTFSSDDLLSNIEQFIDTPDGGVSWQVFGETKQHEYNYTDKEGMDWSGVRPEFTDSLKKLDGQNILMQGYMFPLEQEEKQSFFLLGPFPLSCPFHYHVTPNLIIEVHAKTPFDFSYDAINVKGKLEIVPQDDEYNVFYRLHDAELM